MKKAARAIIVQGNQLLLVHRNKYGSEYYTLVGGRQNDNETLEQTLAREVMEETGLKVSGSKLIFIENHPHPYSQQYIYLCEVAPFDKAKIQDDSEEGIMNKHVANIHSLVWADISSFHNIAFRTPQLQNALTYCLENGFPKEPTLLDASVQQQFIKQKKFTFGRRRQR